MTVREAERALGLLLAPAAGEEAPLEARFLLEHVLKRKPAPFETMPAEAFSAAETLSKRRLSGEPLQYILGEWEFMGLSFKVGPGALIPRPETELLAELVLKDAKPGDTALDVCTGTGCIGISLAVLGGLEVTLSDISPEALFYARENLARHQVRGRVLEGDMFGALGKEERFSVIACNPPYLTGKDMDARQKELFFEPETALYGGEDGLEFYRRLAAEADERLLPGGRLYMETGCTEGEAVRNLFPGSSVYKDLGGLDRVVVYRKQ